MEPKGNILVFSEPEQRLAQVPEVILRSEAPELLARLSNLAILATERCQDLQMSPIRGVVAERLKMQAKLSDYGILLVQLQRVVDPQAVDGVNEIVQLWSKKAGS